MKVLLLTTTFLPAYGGVEKFLATLFGDQAALHVDVLTEPGADVVPKWKLIRQPLLTGKIRPRWLQTLWQIPKLVSEQKYDVIVLGHYAPYLAGAFNARKKFGTKVVVITHGYDVLSYDTAGGFRRWWLRRHLRSANLVVANSQFTNEHLKRLGVAESRRTVLTPGAEIPIDVLSKAEARQKLQLPADSQVLLTVGRLANRKGHTLAVDAVAQLVQTFPKLHYLIVGRGSEEGSIQQRIAKHKLEAQVHVLNNVEDTSIVYAAADLFLFPSTEGGRGNVEGFGLVSVEAQMHGLPVIPATPAAFPKPWKKV
jgi:glycosyltransferase involved in cell wall biosynthesis